jgi:hypothetical protein
MDLVSEGFISSDSPLAWRLLWIKLLLARGQVPHLTVKLRSDFKGGVTHRVQFTVLKATRQKGMYYGWALEVRPRMINRRTVGGGAPVTYTLSLRPPDRFGRLDPLK